MNLKISASIEPTADFLDETVFVQGEVPVNLKFLPPVVELERILLILLEDNSFLAFHVRLSPHPQATFEHVGSDEETRRYNGVIAKNPETREAIEKIVTQFIIG